MSIYDRNWHITERERDWKMEGDERGREIGKMEGDVCVRERERNGRLCMILGVSFSEVQRCQI
jgi:hypothetical protein